MSFYTDFEDSLFDALTLIFPTVPILFAYDNGPEEVTPYIMIQVISLDQVGRESISTLTNSDRQVKLVKHYEGFVSIKVIGDESTQSSAGDIAADLDFLLESPAVQDALLRNNLSLMRKSLIRRIPMFKDSVWYMAYQSDFYFGFSVEALQTTDTIETVELESVFTKQYPSPPIVVTETIN